MTGSRHLWRVVCVGFAAGKHAQCVRQQVQHGLKRGDRAARTAGQVQDDGLAAGAAQAAAEGGKGCLGQAGGAHLFGNAFDEAIADGACGLRCDVTGSDAGAAGGDDEAGGSGVEPECLFKLWLVVGDEEDGVDGEPCVGKDAGDCGTGEVFSFAGGAGVADGDDDGAGHGLIVDG